MARGGGAWAASAAVMLWWASAGAGAVWLDIPPSGTKCVAEEIRNNVVVIGDYSVLYEHHQVHPTVSVKVICLCPARKIGGMNVIFYAANKSSISLETDWHFRWFVHWDLGNISVELLQ
jgi:hypothetical protein